MKTATIVFFLFSCLCVRAQNRSRELGYEQPIFDSDTCCWRKLAKNNEYEKAGDLIVSYLKNNKKTLQYTCSTLACRTNVCKSAKR